MRVGNFFGSHDFNGIDFIVLMRLVDGVFDFNESRANQADQIVIGDFNINKFLNPIQRN